MKTLKSLLRKLKHRSLTFLNSALIYLATASGSMVFAAAPSDPSSHASHVSKSARDSEAKAVADSEQPNLESREGWPEPVMDHETYSFFLADLFEYNPSGSSGSLEWDLLGWVGGDYRRIWLRSEGAQRGRLSDGGTGNLELLYGWMIAPYFDFQVGLAHERLWGQRGGASRFQGVISLDGLSPYSFEIEPALFISQNGDVSARFTASQDVLFTQRAILQARLETNAALQHVEEFGIRSGLNDLSLGLRLRYELRRELAPYVGVNWSALFGEEKLNQGARRSEASGFALVGGVRAWF